MSALVEQLTAFHFIRPWWLTILPLALLLRWQVRARVQQEAPVPAGLAPHLAKALRIGATQRSTFLPIDLLAIFVVFVALAAAGPTWSRVPNPLVSQTAPLVVAIKVSKSMEERDVAPSRLIRAKQKALDVFAARAGAATGLIAYAGTAHKVVPLTQDPDILKPFLEGLSPEIMPRDGGNMSAALETATEMATAGQTEGAILFIADSIDRADLPAIQAHVAAGGPAIIVLGTTKDSGTLSDIAGINGVTVIGLTPDRADVAAIERSVASAYRAALDQDERLTWKDQGWIFAWPAALLVLLWFRRGWSMRWGVFVLAAALTVPAGPTRADGIVDWFLTPDQQGWLAYQDNKFPRASELFINSAWKGQALYRAGRYEEAAEVLSALDTAQAAFAEGMSYAKSRKYREAITAFETALERDPSNLAAARNLDVTRAILAYIEDAREQSDRDQDLLGADDVVFDNEDRRGLETEVQAETDGIMPSSEQWMRMVDTNVGDFLRSRFRLEQARRNQ